MLGSPGDQGSSSPLEVAFELFPCWALGGRSATCPSAKVRVSFGATWILQVAGAKKGVREYCPRPHLGSGAVSPDLSRSGTTPRPAGYDAAFTRC